jgi:hypothetical protein
MYLPQHIWKRIYEYDSTYKLLYDTVIKEIELRYDGGRWWIRQSGLYVKGSRKHYGIYTTEWSNREYAELNFLTRCQDRYNVIYYLNLKDVLEELIHKLKC